MKCRGFLKRSECRDEIRARNLGDEAREQTEDRQHDRFLTGVLERSFSLVFIRKD